MTPARPSRPPRAPRLRGTAPRRGAPATRLDEVRVDRVDAKQPLGRHLVLLFRAFEDELLDALAARGWRDVTMADLQVLRSVAPEGTTAAAIARLAGISKQAVARTIAGLEASGYLRRRPGSADAREKRIVFSAKGVRLIEEAIDLIAGTERRYADALGAEGLAGLKRQLATLLALHPTSAAAGGPA